MRTDRETPRPAWVRYAGAVVGSAVALLFTSVFWPLFRHTPALPSLVAVFAVGWLCGGGPSLLTVVLCTVGVVYFFLPPIHSLRIESEEGAAVLGGFLVVAVLGGLAFTRLRAARRRQAELIEDADRAREISETAAGERTREALQRLAAIVESSDDTIISKDLDGTITSWNAAAQRLFGYTAEEVLGRSISVLMPPEQRAEMALILEKIRCGERVDHFETVRLKKSGERVPVSLTVSPIKDAAGRIVGASKIARDITERKKLEAERERLFREAQEAARVREEFLAVAGHELRTPLTTL
jgi:PAS domain S-box-containing protein